RAPTQFILTTNLVVFIISLHPFYALFRFSAAGCSVWVGELGDGSGRTLCTSPSLACGRAMALREIVTPSTTASVSCSVCVTRCERGLASSYIRLVPRIPRHRQALKLNMVSGRPCESHSPTRALEGEQSRTRDSVSS